jgi:hypothetical protein
MGTHGYLAIASTNGKHYRKIIGMTSDGFPRNLQSIAIEFMILAYTHGLIDQVRANNDTVISALIDEVAKKCECFTDDERRAAWISYSAELNPVEGIITFYDGMIGEEVLGKPIKLNVEDCLSGLWKIRAQKAA